MWNAGIYNRYGKERIQPSIDLVNRILDKDFNKILDVGCGTGMSTAPLAENWKTAEITGVDLSEEMLQVARETIPSASFVQRDCSKSLKDMGKFDLIFSNAFLQWIPNQEEFITNSFEMLNDGGIFATQIPLFDAMPANECLLNAEKVMSDKFSGIESEKYVFHSPAEYYDIMAKSTDNITMWSTDYFHEMDDHNQVLDFLKGAALRPHLGRLNETEQNIFMEELLKNLMKTYPCQNNGKVLFPFKRLFILGEK